MSSKASKRRQKRLNTNEDDEPLAEKTEKKNSPKKIEEEPTEIILIEDEHEVTEPEQVEVVETEKFEEQNGCKGFDVSVENGQNEEAKEEEKNGETEAVPEAQKSVETEEIEHLVVESDNEEEVKETRPETPESESPLRRSSRRIQKPQISETNGMETKITNDVRVNVMRMEFPEVVEQKEEETFEEAQEVTEETEIEEHTTDVTNSSIFVNYGNDTTRNFDITTTSVAEETISFAETHKDISYGEALRTLTGRRMLRGSRESPFRSRYCKTTLEQRDHVDSSRKSYIPHISSVKRKGLNDSPDEHKRFKTEDSPGLLSYISSPVITLRNKLTRSEIPSSTPKLTSYKFTHQPPNIIDDVSDIDLEEKTEPRKWCSIM